MSEDTRSGGVVDGQRQRAVGRKSLPGPRAVAGGLLVTLSVALTLRVGAASDQSPDTKYLVATTDREVGVRLQPSDFEAVALELPDSVSAAAIPAGEGLVGAVTLGPVAAGQLISPSDVLVASEHASGPVRELSLPIPQERALQGRLVPGEIVDILATTGLGADSETVAVARSARVLAVETSDQSIASAGTVVVTLAVPDDETAIALAHAASTAEVTVVRGVVG